MIDPECAACTLPTEGHRFIPRASCGDWHSWEIVAYQLANVTIFACYLSIAAVLLWALRTETGQRLTEAQAAYARVTFASFILVCGVGHLEGILSFVWPRYDIFTWWHMFTALVSMNAAGGAFVLRRGVAHAL